MKLSLIALLAGLSGLAAVAQNEPNQPVPAEPAPADQVQPAETNPVPSNPVPQPAVPTPAPNTAAPVTPPAATPATAVTPATNAPGTSPRVPALPRQFPRPSSATNAAAPATPPAFPTLTPRPRPAGTPNQPAAAGASTNETEVVRSEDGTEIISFKNMPVDQFLSEYQAVAQRIVLRGQNLPLQAQINFSVPDGLTLNLQERQQMYDTILALNGITMIPTGEKAVLAVPANQALQEGGAFSDKSAKDYAEASQFVTHVVQLKFVDIQDAVDTVKQFAKNQNGIVGIPATKTLVLRDYAINVKRMVEVLEKIDIEVEQDYVFEVIPIRYGKVEEVYSTVSSITGGGGGGGFLGGSSALGTAGRTSGAGNRFGGGSSGMSGRSGSQSTSRSSRNSRNTGFGNQFNQQQVNQGGALQNQVGGQTFQQRFNQLGRGGGGGGAGSYLLGDLEITPDMRSNSLIVYGSKKDIAQLKKILEKVDTLLAQVLIEGVIMDVSIGDNLTFGVSYGQRPTQFGNGGVGAGSVNNGTGQLSQVSSNLLSASSFAFPQAAGFNYFAKLGSDWDATLQAIATDDRVNIIQRPRILTSHAVPANFFVGDTVPFISGSYFGVVGSAASTYYDQRDVGIGLDVTPFITPDSLVVMEISQTIEELTGKVPTSANDPPPSTAKREATSQVSVRSGEAILLGGFMRNDTRVGHSGVPVLKDIPILGYLFKTTASQKKRSELMILVRPTVLTTPEEAAKLADKQRRDSPGLRILERDFKQEEKHLQRRADRLGAPAPEEAGTLNQTGNTSLVPQESPTANPPAQER